ncbi:MAG: chemotaxis protein CheB [Hasllibacter sp.]
MTDGADRLVVVGGSAGSLAALVDMLAQVPADFPIPIVIASHAAPGSRLPQVLEMKPAIGLPVRAATDGMDLAGPCAIVLPDATHGMVTGRTLRLSDLVRDSGFRPSIDALFMTAAASYGRGTVGVVLSGTLSDGMRGAQVIYDMGGRTVVQDPGEAERAEMPRSVIRADHPHAVRPADGLGRWLADLA